MKSLPSILLFLLLCAGCQPRGLPEYQGKSLRYWEGQAVSENADTRRSAVKALRKIGPKGLPTLVKLLRDKNHRVQAAANLAVISMQQKVVPQLKELLRDADPDVRAGACKAYFQAVVGKGSEEAVPQLIELLRDTDPGVRAGAAKALLLTGKGKAKEAIPALKEAAGDKNPVVRKAARLTLKVLNADQSTAKPFIRIKDAPR